METKISKSIHLYQFLSKTRLNQMLCLVMLFSATPLSFRTIPEGHRLDLFSMPIWACLLIALNFKGLKRAFVENRLLLLNLGIFYGWIWICAGLSPYFKTAFINNVIYLTYILIFIALLSIISNPSKTGINVHRLIFYSIVFLGFLGTLEFFFPDFWLFNGLGASNRHYPQVMSLMTNPNPFGTLMAIGVGLATVLKKQNLIHRGEFYLGMSFLLMAIAFSSSRNGWMVFALFLLFGLFYKILSLKEAVIYSLALLSIVLFFPNPTYRFGLGESEIFPLLDTLDNILKPYGISIPEAGFRSLTSSDPTSTALSRFVLWKAAIAQIIKHPVTGIGVGAFAEHIGPEVMGRTGLHAHNLFLNLAAETGLPGLLIFLIFLGQIIQKAMTQHRIALTFISLILISQMPDLFVRDGTFMMVSAYCFAMVCHPDGLAKSQKLKSSENVALI